MYLTLIMMKDLCCMHLDFLELNKINGVYDLFNECNECLKALNSCFLVNPWCELLNPLANIV